jgi:hypothetical protein
MRKMGSKMFININYKDFSSCFRVVLAWVIISKGNPMCFISSIPKDLLISPGRTLKVNYTPSSFSRVSKKRLEILGSKVDNFVSSKKWVANKISLDLSLERFSKIA